MNDQLRKGMRRSPYRAIFEHDVKFGFATFSAVPNDVINTLTSEEDLEQFLVSTKTDARDEQFNLKHLHKRGRSCVLCGTDYVQLS